MRKKVYPQASTDLAPSSSRPEFSLPGDAIPAFMVAHPVSFWNRPLKTDFTKLFACFGGAIAAFTFGRWDSGIKSILDGIATVSIDKPGEPELAWRLIFIALTRAADSLIGEAATAALFNTHELSIVDRAAHVAAQLEDIPIILYPDFFEHPEKLSLVGEFGKVLACWLLSWGLEPARANAISGRLLSYFVFELRREWRKNPTAYEALLHSIRTPFDAACEKEQSWLEYSAGLKKQISEPMFNESFSLSDIYISLRGVYERKVIPKSVVRSKADDHSQRSTIERVGVDLQNHLLNWVRKCDATDTLRVISGGPGSGKSSFCKIFAANNAELLRAENITTVFISLHNFEPTENLIMALHQHLVEDTRQLSFNPLGRDELESRSVFLICDGLDELSQRGYVGARVASDFVRVLTVTLSKLNADGDVRLRALITGRDIVISSNKAVFHGEHLVEVLPFCRTREQEARWPTVWDDEVSPEDQRDLWWQKYGRLTGREYSDLPPELLTLQLLEVTALPLLNYLVSLAWERRNDESGIKFDEKTSLNDIYEDLIRAVYNRAYEPAKGKSRRHSAIANLSEDVFFLLLEEIALSAWHGVGRKTTVSDIHRHLKNGGLLSLIEALDQIERDARTGITKLLVAFFFRESEMKGAMADDTFEFTHRSFGEYLTARRLARLMTDITEERQRKVENPTRGWDIPESLDRWAGITGPTRMDPYLFDFFTNEVVRKLRRNEAEARRWRDTFNQLFQHAVVHGTPMQGVPTADFQTLKEWTNNAEESLLAAFHACLVVAGRDASDILGIESESDRAAVWEEFFGFPWAEHERSALGTWLHRIRGQRPQGEIPVVLRSLNRMDLSNLTLNSQDLAGAHLSGANLCGAYLENANLRSASLERAAFRGAHMANVCLTNAVVTDACLLGADLNHAIAIEADFSRSNLLNTNTKGANFTRAKLRRTRTGHQFLHKI